MCIRDSLSADMLDGSHVLCDLRAEIGAIDHSRVAVWVHTIYAVAVEGEGRAGLHCRAKHQPHDVLDGDACLLYTSPLGLHLQRQFIRL